MLSEICREIRNWFDVAQFHDQFEIVDGALIGFDDLLQEDQYFRIVGSVFNDGVYQYPTTSLRDEKFAGAVWAMAIPPELIALDTEITAWCEKYASVDSASMSPYQSESFGGYSYSKSGGGASDGETGGGTWQSAFANQLNAWRKIR